MELSVAHGSDGSNGKQARRQQFERKIQEVAYIPDMRLPGPGPEKSDGPSDIKHKDWF